MTLLDKAKQAPRPRQYQPITKEKIDLTLAWLKGEIAISQAERVLYGHSGGMGSYVLFARALRYLYQMGVVQLKGEKYGNKS